MLLRALPAALLALSTAAHGNPTGQTVVNGSATFSSSGGTLTVNNTPNTIINWQSFSIGSGEATRFNQQSSSSAVLNRVTGIDASAIFGALSSNGRIFLVNPNGVLFGASSQVNAAGLVASTLDLSNANFISGNLQFTPNASAGPLVANGAINAPGGSVTLVANAISLTGSIVADSIDIRSNDVNSGGGGTIAGGAGLSVSFSSTQTISTVSQGVLLWSNFAISSGSSGTFFSQPNGGVALNGVLVGKPQAGVSFAVLSGPNTQGAFSEKKTVVLTSGVEAAPSRGNNAPQNNNSVQVVAVAGSVVVPTIAATRQAFQTAPAQTIATPRNAATLNLQKREATF